MDASQFALPLPEDLRETIVPCSDDALRKCISAISGYSKDLYLISDFKPYDRVPLATAVLLHEPIVAVCGSCLDYSLKHNDDVWKGLVFEFAEDNFEPLTCLNVAKSGSKLFQKPGNVNTFWRRVDNDAMRQAISPCGLTNVRNLKS